MNHEHCFEVYYKLVVALVLAMTVHRVYGQEATAVISPSSHYVVDRKASRVIVFVHGLNGNARDTWMADPTHYWPQMVANDHNFIDTDVYAASYPTPSHGNKMSINDLISFLADELEADGVFSRHQHVIFVAHSLGGIVVQQLLLTYRDKHFYQKVPFIYFYATPQTGSELANIGKLFQPDPLIKELARGEGNFILPSMDTAWLHSDFTSVKRYCAYETQSTKGFKVIDRESATRGCQDQVAIDANHINIVKPISFEARSYTALRNKFIEMTSQSEESALKSNVTEVNQQCPNGICVGGNNSAPLTVNNFEKPVPPERRITQRSGEAAVAILQTVLLPPHVEIIIVDGDSEIRFFARQLDAVLSNAKWPVDIHQTDELRIGVEAEGGGFETYKGEGLICYHQPRVNQAIVAVRQALAIVGFPCKDISSQYASPGIELIVGTRLTSKER